MMGTAILRLRKSAKGQDCTLRLPCCSWDIATTVLAHLRCEAGGMGTKGDDWHAVFACAACHRAYDLKRYPPELLDEASLRGLQRTQRFWFAQGMLKAG